MSRVMTYLSKDEYARFKNICDREDCTSYMLIKKAVLDHIWAYSLEKAPAPENEALKQDLGETVIKEVAEVEPAVTDAEELSESVRRILERKSD